MSAPSAFLEVSQTRLSDRGSLLLRDINIMTEGLAGKADYLKDLRKQFLKHRLEDMQQIREARQQLWSSWDERVRRLEDWMRETADASRASATLVAWKRGALGFERIQGLNDKFTAAAARRAELVDKLFQSVFVQIRQWDERLKTQEADLRAFLERQAAKTTELMVSKARKQPYLDFAYHEREMEGKLSTEMKFLRTSVNRMMDRITKAQSWVGDRAAQAPGHFDDRKQDTMMSLARHRARFNELREKIMELALFFESGRQRLRWIYEQIQRMHVVSELNVDRRPLLYRLFGIED